MSFSLIVLSISSHFSFLFFHCLYSSHSHHWEIAIHLCVCFSITQLFRPLYHFLCFHFPFLSILYASFGRADIWVSGGVLYMEGNLARESGSSLESGNLAGWYPRLLDGAGGVFFFIECRYLTTHKTIMGSFSGRD
ncbi:hypothetical protein V2G26_008456 [Clonostachys chloroleuca]